MAAKERREMATPGPSHIVVIGNVIFEVLFALIVVTIVVPATLMAVLNLVAFSLSVFSHTTVVYGSYVSGANALGFAAAASCIWLAMVGYAIRTAYRFHGSCRLFVINHVGVFVSKRFVEIACQGTGSAEFGYGYRLFGRRLLYYRVPLDRIEMVEWHPSDTDTSCVALWINRDDPEASQRERKHMDRKPGQDIYGIETAAGREETRVFGLALVAFLHNAGATLVPGKDDCTYVWATESGEARPVRSRKGMIGPDEDACDRGAKYSCQIARRGDGHSGVVFDEHGDVRWRYGVRKNKSGRSWGNPFNKKDFVVTNPQTREEVILRRVSFASSRFRIIDAQGERGAVRKASILRNKYTIEVSGRRPWTFKMPLFTIRFWGETDESSEFWVMLGSSKMEWNILVKPGVDDQPLVAALSFIHVEWWNYG
jgi:hypothetical protein